MKRPIALLAMSIVLSTGVLLPPSAKADSNDEKAIKALFATFASKMAHKDFDGITKLCSPDFAITANGVTKDVKTATAEMKQKLATVDIKSYSITPLKIKITGKTAVVSLKSLMELRFKESATVSHIVAAKGTSDGVVVKDKGVWLLKSDKNTSSTMTLDGKPFQMPGGAPPPSAPKR